MPRANGSRTRPSSIRSGSRASSTAPTQIRYDQLVIWTDSVTTTGNAFAYKVTVANDVRGIGLPIFDSSSDFGSSGRLESFTVMDWLGKYPEDPLQKFLGGEQHGQRPRSGGWAPLARVSGGPRRRRTTIGRAPRAGPGALELLLRFRRVGHGGERHRGSWRRPVPDRRRPWSGIRSSTSTPWGSSTRARCHRSSTLRVR